MVSDHRHGRQARHHHCVPRSDATVALQQENRISIRGDLPASGSVLVGNRSNAVQIAVLSPITAGTTETQVQAYFDGGAEGPWPFPRPGPSVGTDFLSPGKELVLTYRRDTGHLHPRVVHARSAHRLAHRISGDVPRRRIGLTVASSTHPHARLRLNGMTREPRRTGASMAGAGNTAHQLPVFLSRFVGREPQLDELKALFGDSRSRKANRPSIGELTRLVTLTGVGGAGKTRLAHEFCVRLATRSVGPCFPGSDGVDWVTFESVSDPSRVPHEVAAALGLQNVTSATPIDAVLNVLSDRRALLVLDNCENVSAACGQLIQTLMSECPLVTFLATSRERLRLDSEHVFPVPALQLATGPVGPANRVNHSDAVSLFLDRAKFVTAGHPGDGGARTPSQRSVSGWKDCRWPSSSPPAGSVCCRPKTYSWRLIEVSNSCPPRSHSSLNGIAAWMPCCGDPGAGWIPRDQQVLKRLSVLQGISRATPLQQWAAPAWLRCQLWWTGR